MSRATDGLFGQNGHHSGLCQRFAQTTSLVFRLPYQFARTWYAELGIGRRCLLLPVNNRNVQKSALFVGFVLLVALAVHFTGFEMWSLPPHLVDQCDKQGTDWAPIVVVGVLSSDALVRIPVPMQSDPQYPLQLRRLKVQVENVLKGESIPGTIVVYYFTWAGGFDGPQPLGYWKVGSRRILWLRKDSGVLRTVCDGWDGCTMSVQSGAHRHYRLDPQKALNYALVDLRLTRGEGPIDEIGFANEIERGVPVGIPDQALQVYEVEKLRRLVLTEHGDVKSSVCQQLWLYGTGRMDPSTSLDANQALDAASCRCTAKPYGNVDCQ